MPDPELRPTWRFVASHPAHWLAFGGGAGLSPLAPGTVGTLLAFPIFWFLQPRVPSLAYLGVVAIMFIAGIWACDRTGRILGVSDHGGMVWDEVVAFLLVLFFIPASVIWQASAFLLFRLFDILKPPPIRHFDRTVKNGFGVMLDDMIAALYTLLTLALWRTFSG